MYYNQCMSSIYKYTEVTRTITRCDALLAVTFEHVCMACDYDHKAVRKALKRAGYVFNPRKSYLFFSDMVRWVKLKHEYVV